MAEPGLYFIKAPGGRLHIDSYEHEEWYVMGCEVGGAQPDGEILSGPHTPQELYEAMKAAEDAP